MSDSLWDLTCLFKNGKNVFYAPKEEYQLSKERIYERHLSKDKEEVRLKEIEEQYNAVVKNENMMNKFDYVFTNNYDQDSEDRMIELIQTIMNSENN